jgi:selenoprotein W-related protein
MESSLIAGGGGIFDVEYQGKLIYSKHQTGVFPEFDHIVEMIRNTK